MISYFIVISTFIIFFKRKLFSQKLNSILGWTCELYLYWTLEGSLTLHLTPFLIEMFVTKTLSFFPFGENCNIQPFSKFSPLNLHHIKKNIKFKQIFRSSTKLSCLFHSFYITVPLCYQGTLNKELWNTTLLMHKALYKLLREIKSIEEHFKVPLRWSDDRRVTVCKGSAKQWENKTLSNL